LKAPPFRGGVFLLPRTLAAQVYIRNFGTKPDRRCFDPDGTLEILGDFP
jgi:hypothetical protein